MARVPLPIGSSEDTLLRDISNFVRDLPNSSYSSLICFSNDNFPPGNLGFSVELRDSRDDESLRHDHVAEGSAMQVLRILVECPTWMHAQFAFYGLGLAALVLEIFSLLRSSRSLSTLDIRSNHLDGRFLPTLLCENPFLETLILYPAGPCNLEDAERLALCFARNSVLKSCILTVDSGRNFQVWETLLRPFTTSSKSDANLSLKELVVVVCQEWVPARLRSLTSGDPLANLVSFNTTLEKLDLRMSRYSDAPTYWAAATSFSRALAVNHTLKEFCCCCNLAQLKELVGVFIPEPSGHQANTHLTTLRLLSTLTCVEDYLQELSRMIKSNTALKHVEVVFSGVGPMSSRMIWEVRSIKPLQCREHHKVCTQDILEKMMRKELRVNTSLQSLIVGSWKLGGHWQMSYGGPCLGCKGSLTEGEPRLTIALNMTFMEMEL